MTDTELLDALGAALLTGEYGIVSIAVSRALGITEITASTDVGLEYDDDFTSDFRIEGSDLRETLTRAVEAVRAL